MAVQGNMVQDMYDAGRLAEINDYCRCDVLDTYFVFLRTRVLLGQLALDAEQQLIAQHQALAGEQGRGLAGVSALSRPLGRLAQSLGHGRSKKWLTKRRVNLYFKCQGVWCDCLVDGVLTGPPHEASGGSRGGSPLPADT